MFYFDKWLCRVLLRLLGGNKPNHTVMRDILTGEGPDRRLYLRRFFIYPRTWQVEHEKKQGIRVFIHCFAASDDDRELHDHPWNFVTTILKGTYIEETVNADAGWPLIWTLRRKPLKPAFRTARTVHRVKLDKYEGVERCVWTLMVCGSRQRKWGYLTGWMGWDQQHGERSNGVPS